MSTCSSEKALGAPPKLTAPMSSPCAIIGTTMYVSTPEASSASAASLRGSAAVSITCSSPRASALTSPMSVSGKRTPGPRCSRRRPMAASHSASPASRSKRLTMARGTSRRSRSRFRAASAMATGASAAISARSISWSICRRSDDFFNDACVSRSSVMSMATTSAARRPANSRPWEAVSISRMRPSFRRCFQNPRRRSTAAPAAV